MRWIAGAIALVLLLAGCFDEMFAADFPLEQEDFYGEWSSSLNKVCIEEAALYKRHSTITGGVDLYAVINGWEPARPSEGDIPRKEDRLIYSKGFALSAVHDDGSFNTKGKAIPIRVFINKEKDTLYYGGSGIFTKLR